jgi:GNAT superfamily N-acetyltransferase
MASAPPDGRFRLASAVDVDAVTATITSAFLADPAWAPTLARLRRAERGGAEIDRGWWRLFVLSGLAPGWLWVTDRCEAAAAWFPPGAPELAPAEAAAAATMLAGLPAADAAYFEAFNELFERARPEEPHYYLSLLGTHGDHRGQGLGMALLAHTLTHVDSTGLPAYLESTNPANLRRYRSVGFEDLDEFPLPGGGPVITTMWRPADRPDVGPA